MKTGAKLFISVFAFTVASYLVHGNDVQNLLGCAKVYAIHVMILIALALVSCLTEDDK